jgi:hypothetical protein
MGSWDAYPRLPRLWVVIAVTAVAGFLVWLVAIRDGDDEVPEPEQPGAPVLMEEDELSALSSELDHPVYWAGAQEGAQIEVTRTEDGRVTVRYLTGGAEAGAPEGEFLAVGTYPVADAQANLEGAGERKGALRGETPDGDLVVTNEDAPTNVYLADPVNDLQVEVYDPDPERAFELATGGEIVPVG